MRQGSRGGQAHNNKYPISSLFGCYKAKINNFLQSYEARFAFSLRRTSNVNWLSVGKIACFRATLFNTIDNSVCYFFFDLLSFKHCAHTKADLDYTSQTSF